MKAEIYFFGTLATLLVLSGLRAPAATVLDEGDLEHSRQGGRCCWAVLSQRVLRA